MDPACRGSEVRVGSAAAILAQDGSSRCTVRVRLSSSSAQWYVRLVCLGLCLEMMREVIIIALLLGVYCCLSVSLLIILEHVSKWRVFEFERSKINVKGQ